MKTSSIAKRQELIEKQEVLENAKSVLKQEFAGINRVIDEVINSVSSWYLFPKMQDKPVVINLWGLTGTGKSSLVNRLAQLLKYEKKYFQFNLGGNYFGGSGISSQLEEFVDNEPDIPLIIALDEFQHARTIDDNGCEIESRKEKNIMWELLDSGKYQVRNMMVRSWELYRLKYKLNYCLNNGVRAKQGKVIAGEKIFYDLFHNDNEEKSEPIESDFNLVPYDYESCIIEASRNGFKSETELRQHLNQLNHKQTMRFINDVIKIANSAKTVNCSKSLIFVMGNLDEAYRMSSDFNPDINADEFHRLSSKIDLTNIKHSLKRRFRNEEIARLGNIHIIYSAFSRKTFERIIKMQLSKIQQKVHKKQGVTLEFHPSVHKLIYREGVYPTQGTRPVFSTVHQIINTKLGKVISEFMVKTPTANRIYFRSEPEALTAEFLKGEDSLHTLRLPHKLNLESLRKQKKDDKQAVVAVHESGHAIIAATLMRTLPQVIHSHTVDVNSNGFIHAKCDWTLVSGSEIIDRIALFMGGMAAEELVFGSDRRTTGSANDLEKATEFITEMIKEESMGGRLGSFNVPSVGTNQFLHDTSGKLDEAAETRLRRGLDRAKETLSEQMPLLLAMADHLSNHPKMTAEEMRSLAIDYGKGINAQHLRVKGEPFPYRKMLKNKINSMSTRNEHVLNGKGIVLNKHNHE